MSLFKDKIHFRFFFRFNIPNTMTVDKKKYETRVLKMLIRMRIDSFLTFSKPLKVGSCGKLLGKGPLKDRIVMMFV